MSKIHTYSVDYNLVRQIAREKASSEDRSTTPILSEERETESVSPTVSAAASSPRSSLSSASSESFSSPRAQDDQETKSLNYLLESIFSVEQTVHPELKAFHERLKSAETALLTEEEKSSHFSSLVESMKVENPDLTLPSNYKEFPASEEVKEFLRTHLNPPADDRDKQGALNRNVGILAAKSALMIAEGKPDLEMRSQLNEDIESYTKSQTQEQDFNRMIISFRKNGKTLELCADDGSNFEDYKAILQQKNEELSLGLTGEQMEYIIRSTDQSGTQTTGQNFKMRHAMDHGMSIPPIENTQLVSGRELTTKERSMLVEISPAAEGQKVTLKAQHAGFIAIAEDMYKANGSLTLETVETDISALKGERMLLGICTSEVPTKFTASLINSGLEFPVPESVKADLPEGFDHVAEFCKTKMKAVSDEKIDSLEKCATLISSSHPKLRKKLAIAASEIKGYDIRELNDLVQTKVTTQILEFDRSKASNNTDLANYLAGKNPERGSIPTGRNYENNELSGIIASVIEARGYRTEAEKTSNITEIVSEYGKVMNMDVKQTGDLAFKVASHTAAESTDPIKYTQSITTNVVHEIISASAQKQTELAARPVPRRVERQEQYAAELKQAKKETTKFAKQGLTFLEETCGMSKDAASRALSRSYISTSPETRSIPHGRALRKAFESMPASVARKPPARHSSKISALHK